MSSSNFLPSAFLGGQHYGEICPRDKTETRLDNQANLENVDDAGGVTEDPVKELAWFLLHRQGEHYGKRGQYSTGKIRLLKKRFGGKIRILKKRPEGKTYSV